jgi:hypothetical protein
VFPRRASGNDVPVLVVAALTLGSLAAAALSLAYALSRG